jgi:hypothetical protein
MFEYIFVGCGHAMAYGPGRAAILQRKQERRRYRPLLLYAGQQIGGMKKSAMHIRSKNCSKLPRSPRLKGSLNGQGLGFPSHELCDIFSRLCNNCVDMRN